MLLLESLCHPIVSVFSLPLNTTVLDPWPPASSNCGTAPIQKPSYTAIWPSAFFQPNDTSPFSLRNLFVPAGLGGNLTINASESSPSQQYVLSLRASFAFNMHHPDAQFQCAVTAAFKPLASNCSSFAYSVLRHLHVLFRLDRTMFSGCFDFFCQRVYMTKQSFLLFTTLFERLFLVLIIKRGRLLKSMIFEIFLMIIHVI